ncbi:MAG: hypothetical protein WC824_02390 [Bacteroidota bacterium]|jgi:hypothetical protein
MCTRRTSIASILLAIFICTAAASGQSRVLFQGSVTGYDGKPLKKAQVEMWRYQWGNHFAGKVGIAVGNDGGFITKLYPGLYSIRFSGVDHEFSEKRYLYIDPEIDCRVDVRMRRSRFVSLGDIDTLFVVYTEPAEGSNRKLVPMEPMGGGKFQARFSYNGVGPTIFAPPETRRPLDYHIFGIVPERSVNGTDQDGYLYDNDGDFFSVKHTEDTLITVTFDYSLLAGMDQNKSIQDEKYRISGAPLAHPYALLQQRLDQYQQIRGGCALPFADSGSVEWQYYLAQGIEPRKLSDTTGIAILESNIRAEQADSASVYWSGIMQSRARRDQSMLDCNLYLYLNAVSYSEIRANRNALNESSENLLSILRFALDSLSPSSQVWNLRDVYKSFFVLSDTLAIDYAYRVLRENPSSTARFLAYEMLKDGLKYDRSTQRDQRRKELAIEAQAIFKGTIYEDPVKKMGSNLADEAAYKRSGYVDLVYPTDGMARFLSIPADSNSAGKAFPTWSFSTLADSTKYLSSDDLSGVPYVLILGTISTDDFLSLQEIYSKYHDAGLRIVQVWSYQKSWGKRFPTEDTVLNSYRREGFTLPWTHVQAEYEKIQDMRLALKSYISNSYLLSPKGIILASERQMESIMKEFAVRQYFESGTK